ncbi:MAG: hypothetical protein ACKON9_18245, partial [Planctomycetaceae bacterium]
VAFGAGYCGICGIEACHGDAFNSYGGTGCLAIDSDFPFDRESGLAIGSFTTACDKQQCGED